MDFTVKVLLTVAFAVIVWRLFKFLIKYRRWCDIMASKQISLISKPHPFLGHLHLLKEAGDVYDYAQDTVEKTKTKLVGIWIGMFFPVLSAVHPETIKVLMKSSAPKPTFPGSAYDGLSPWLGEGLLISNSTKWERNRRLLTPAFHFDILRPYVEIYNEVADVLVKKFASFSSIESVDISKHVGLAAFDTMLRCAFSYESNMQLEETNNKYLSAVNKLGNLGFRRTMKPWQFWYPMFLLTPSGRTFSKLAKYIHDFDEEIINKRIETINKDKTVLHKKRLDFLDILLSAKDENGVGLTKREVRDEVDTFLFEGHDTTSSAIMWAIYALAKHQDEQAKVYEEIQKVMENRKNIEWDDFNKFTKLSMFIKESMRYYTPVPGMSRLTTKETIIDGITIPANMEVFLLTHISHNRSDVWDKPQVFDPQRFEDSKVKDRDPYQHVPFSAGPRNCIGQHFALNEIKVTLVKILQKFKVTVDPDKVPVCYPEVVMRTRNTGIHIFFNLRKS